MVRFCTGSLLVALVLWVWSTAYPRFADIIWSDFAYGYQLMMLFSDGFSWILAVMVMAWFTRPKVAA